MAPEKYDVLGHMWSIGLLTMLTFLITLGALAILRYYQEDLPETTSTIDSAEGNLSQQHLHVVKSHNFWDAIEGDLQRILISFIATFNILPIQAWLENPTREVIYTVVHRGDLFGRLMGYFCVNTYSLLS